MQHRIRQAQLFKIFMLLFTIWLFCAIGQICMLKFDIFGENENLSIFSFILFLMMILLLINPLQFCYRQIRFTLLKTLFQIIISPFGIVRFRHFFLADILTSLTKPLVDIRYCFCFFVFTQQWLKDRDVSCQANENSFQKILDLVITMLPYWFRFAQCLKKFYQTKIKVHLLNAGKYFVSLMIPIFSTLHNETQSLFILFLAVSAIGAMYSYVWDIYMDWGLMRTTKKGHFMLREKILYPSYFYYIAMVTDLILRFAWLVSLYPASVIGQLWGVYFQIFLTDILQWFRRSMWAVLRVQNENINNFERYRAELDIPKLPLQGSTNDLKDKIQLHKLIAERGSGRWPSIVVNDLLEKNKSQEKKNLYAQQGEKGIIDEKQEENNDLAKSQFAKIAKKIYEKDQKN